MDVRSRGMRYRKLDGEWASIYSGSVRLERLPEVDGGDPEFRLTVCGMDGAAPGPAVSVWMSAHDVLALRGLCEKVRP